MGTFDITRHMDYTDVWTITARQLAEVDDIVAIKDPASGEWNTFTGVSQYQGTWIARFDTVEFDEERTYRFTEGRTFAGNDRVTIATVA
jgi:hypothetical protein